MKGLVVILVCAICWSAGNGQELNENGCPVDYSIEKLYPHEDCNKFYQCTYGNLVAHTCAADLFFDMDKQECDYPYTVECGDRTLPDGNSQETTEKVDNGNQDGSYCHHSEAQTICAYEGSDGILVVHENCNQFCKCSAGRLETLICPEGLFYNSFKELCDWAENVDCGVRGIPDSNATGTGKGDSNGENNETCNCNPDEASSICTIGESDGILIAHENCTQFYKCANGRPVVMDCPKGLLYDPHVEICNWSDLVDCGDRKIPECDDEANGGGSNGEANGGSSGEGGDGGNGESDETGGGSEGGGVGQGGGDSEGGSCNCNPGAATTICADTGSEGILIAHENCTQFYKCANSRPVVMDCPEGLLYDPHIEICNWPDLVECGDRKIPECDDEGNGGGVNGGVDGGNGGGGGDGGTGGGGEGDGDSEGGGSDQGDGGGEVGSCNCNPGLAHIICAGAGSDGILIAHENCTQFQKCAHGSPVIMDCAEGLLYDAYIEICNWPHLVECGDRKIPEYNGDSGNGGDSGGGDEGSGGGGGAGESSESDEDSGVGGAGGAESCNCNPEEAPTICRGTESDGTLIVHENCNQFYKCASGSAVALDCPEGLMYDPFLEICNWSYLVNCGDRNVSENDGGGGNNGVGGGIDEGNGGGGGGDGSGGGGGGGVGSCNCNPGEASTICGGAGSDGTLIAHENCTQFYKCANRLPVVFNCSEGLLYDPHLETCNWPHLVKCGDRLIPESGDIENGGSGGHGGGGGVGAGPCNCNPSEALTICTRAKSEGIMIAHENCNQFYKCTLGVPITLNCSEDLFYNPYSNTCESSNFVLCGDRIIPENYVISYSKSNLISYLSINKHLSERKSTNLNLK